MELPQQCLYFIAGLALFFLGQRSLSQGLQTLGSKKVKHIVHFKDVLNPLHNFFGGARLTILAFSPTMSSMVFAGLANANLLKAARALPMMMGVNLGASAIFLILSVGTHNRGLNFIAIGLLLGLVVRSYRSRIIGKTILGIGLTFLGISIMEESMKLLIDWQVIQNTINYAASLSMGQGLWVSTIIGLLLSLSLTSSTMVYAIIVVLSKLEIVAAPICFGMSLGAILATFIMTFSTTKSDARAYAVRQVFVPLVTMIITVVMVIIILPFASDYISFSMSTMDLVILGNVVVSLIAFFHSYLVKGSISNLAKKFFPDGEVKEQSKLKFLGEGRYLSSSMAYVLVEMEIAKLLDIVDRMFKKSEKYIESRQKGARTLAKIKEYERIIDNIQVEIDIFIQKVISSGAGEDDSDKSLKYLKLAASIERLADSLDKLATTLTRFYEEYELTGDEKDRLLTYYSQIYRIFTNAYNIYTDVRKPDEDILPVNEDAINLKKTILAERESFSRVHSKEDVHKHIYFSDVLIALAKLRGDARDIYNIIHNKL